ncbi:transposase [Methylocaldum szegediense]|uniref:transposase n=1 Tax=Methylocaldum szegediense TaxID=73780 RepID=UPI0012EB1334
MQNNLRLLSLPPYAPELDPVEHLWDELREKAFYFLVFDSMDALARIFHQLPLAGTPSPPYLGLLMHHGLKNGITAGLSACAGMESQNPCSTYPPKLPAKPTIRTFHIHDQRLARERH